MRSFTRYTTPQYLAENWEKWGNRYAENKIRNPHHTFQWATHEGERVNQKLLPTLIAQTQEHCSYCDHYPAKISDDTIDHFKPKGDSRFYHLAYQWKNLYYCCADCQRVKMEQFHDSLLRPDENGFSFDRYFEFDPTTFELKPNKAATQEEQECAKITIEILGLNDKGQPESRRQSWKLYYSTPEMERNIDDFAHRFMFL